MVLEFKPKAKQTLHQLSYILTPIILFLEMKISTKLQEKNSKAIPDSIH